MIYEAIKDVIENGDFELRETLDKIYVMYSKDRLSKEEMEELESLAREKANPVNSYAPLQEQIDNIYHVGDKITYNGKKYICKLDNCVWSPVEYPSAWEEVVESEG